MGERTLKTLAQPIASQHLITGTDTKTGHVQSRVDFLNSSRVISNTVATLARGTSLYSNAPSVGTTSTTVGLVTFTATGAVTTANSSVSHSLTGPTIAGGVPTALTNSRTSGSSMTTNNLNRITCCRASYFVPTVTTMLNGGVAPAAANMPHSYRPAISSEIRAPQNTPLSMATPASSRGNYAYAPKSHNPVLKIPNFTYNSDVHLFLERMYICIEYICI